MKITSSIVALTLASAAVAVGASAEVANVPQLQSLVMARVAARAAEDPTSGASPSSPDEPEGPCEDEEDTFFDCIGESCENCILGTLDDHLDALEDKNVTFSCKALDESGYCTDLTTCVTGDACNSTDWASCAASGEALKQCGTDNADPEASSEGCETLCQPSKSIRGFAKTFAAE